MDEIIIVDYNPFWVKQFEAESAKIWQALSSEIARIEHFGSTAVPGLAAKPVIDLLVGVHSLEQSQSRIPLLEALGYVYWQENPHPELDVLR